MQAYRVKTKVASDSSVNLRNLPFQEGETVFGLSGKKRGGLGVSAISCWEVAKLVERGRLQLPGAVGIWLDQALNYPGVLLLPLTPRVAVESTKLPSTFHRDPADQIIVATARVLGCPVTTLDSGILSYKHVQTQP